MPAVKRFRCPPPTFLYIVIRLSDDRPRLAPGTPVTLRVPETALHLFDADTGHRLDNPSLTLAAK